MTNLVDTSTFEAGIYQIETSDPVLGGPGGISNLQGQQLANRTKYLKDHVDALEAAAPGYATQAFVQAELEKLDHKQSVRVASTANLTLSGTQTIDGVATSSGDRILVKNQTIGSQNGIYVISGSGWSRAVDANDSAEVTPGLVVGVEEGTLYGNTRWQLTTDAPIVLGTSALVFADVTAGFAPLASPAFTGNPTAPTATSGDNDTSIATTAFVANAIDGLASLSVAGGTDTTLTAAQAGTGIIVLTGVLTADKNVILPAGTGQYLLVNNTSGAFNLTAKLATGTGVVLPQGYAVITYSDGTNVNFASSTAQASFTATSFTPSAGTTTLTVLGGYTAGNIQIEKNGAWLQPADYTATNGTTITVAATIAGDKFTVYAFKSFTVANALAKSGDTMAGPLLLAADPTVALEAATKQYVDTATPDASTTVKGRIEIATDAEAQALSSPLLAITPSNLKGAFQGSNQSLAASGYQKLPGGLIVQWGTSTTGAGGAVAAVTFPVAFTSLAASITTGAVFGTSASLDGVEISSITTSGFSASGVSAPSTGAAVTFRWIAIGY